MLAFAVVVLVASTMAAYTGFACLVRLSYRPWEIEGLNLRGPYVLEDLISNKRHLLSQDVFGRSRYWSRVSRAVFPVLDQDLARLAMMSVGSYALVLVALGRLLMALLKFKVRVVSSGAEIRAAVGLEMALAWAIQGRLSNRL